MLRKIQIGVFVGLLVVPTLVWVLFFAGTDENLENRQLASFPNLAEASYDTLFADLDEWYDDHTPFKNYAVRIINRANIMIFGDAAAVVIGKDGWLFYKGDGDPIGDYLGGRTYKEQELESYFAQFRAASENLEAQDAELFILVAPNKSHAYEQYLPDEIQSEKGLMKTEQLAAYMEEHGAVGFKYLEVLLDTEENPPELPTYYQLDTHWNPYGAYLGYKEFLTMVGIDQSASEISFSPGVAYEGDLSRMLNQDMVDNNAVTATGTGNAELVYSNEDGFYEVYESTLPDADPRTVLIIGDSYRTNLEIFPAQDFARTVVVHRSYLSSLDMLQTISYKPDIVVLLSPERYVDSHRTVLNMLAAYEF